MFYTIPFLFILGVTINYFVIRNYNFFKLTILLDKEYSKPQSFHKNPVLCFGGSSIYILFLIIFIFFDIKFLKQFFLLATVSFFIGLLEDLKINFKPIFRLILLIISFFFTINFFDININNLVNFK